MGTRVAGLETDVQYIKRDIGDLKQDVREIKSHQREDFRVVMGALIVAALGLAGMMAHGFHWL